VRRKNDSVVDASPEAGVDLAGGGLASVLEAARFLAVSRAKVYSMMDARELPSVKLGKCRRIPREALREYVRQQLVVATA
jgi:excisionase family DNA binding protein